MLGGGFGVVISRPCGTSFTALHLWYGGVAGLGRGECQCGRVCSFLEVMGESLVLQRRVMRKHAQVFFFSYGPFIMGDSHSFVASFKIRATSYLVGQRVVVVLETWPETGFSRPAAILGVNKHSEGLSMLGERSDQRGLWEADRLYLDHVGRDTFYGLLASLRGRLFRDPDFAEFYCADNGRDSVPPSLLATALLLQSHDKVSDAEAKARADFDLRWKSLPSATIGGGVGD